LENYLTLGDILSQLNEEDSAEILAHWADLIQQIAAHRSNAVHLAIAAEDKPGCEYWLKQLHECTEAIDQIRERLRYLRDSTTLELQWLKDTYADFSEPSDPSL
jgi:hypothetical protein